MGACGGSLVMVWADTLDNPQRCLNELFPGSLPAHLLLSHQAISPKCSWLSVDSMLTSDVPCLIPWGLEPRDLGLHLAPPPRWTEN